MRWTAGLLAFALALPLAGGCRRAAEGEPEPETLHQAERAVTVRVVNNSRLDAAIYLVHDGARERIGTVTASASADFPVRGRSLATGDFTLLAAAIGSRRTLSSERLSAAQGSLFSWTLDADLRRGSVLVQE